MIAPLYQDAQLFLQCFLQVQQGPAALADQVMVRPPSDRLRAQTTLRNIHDANQSQFFQQIQRSVDGREGDVRRLLPNQFQDLFNAQVSTGGL